MLSRSPSIHVSPNGSTGTGRPLSSPVHGVERRDLNVRGASSGSRESGRRDLNIQSRRAGSGKPPPGPRPAGETGNAPSNTPSTGSRQSRTAGVKKACFREKTEKGVSPTAPRTDTSFPVRKRRRVYGPATPRRRLRSRDPPERPREGEAARRRSRRVPPRRTRARRRGRKPAPRFRVQRYP